MSRNFQTCFAFGTSLVLGNRIELGKNSSPPHLAPLTPMISQSLEGQKFANRPAKFLFVCYFCLFVASSLRNHGRLGSWFTVRISASRPDCSQPTRHSVERGPQVFHVGQQFQAQLVRFVSQATRSRAGNRASSAVRGERGAGGTRFGSGGRGKKEVVRHCKFNFLLSRSTIRGVRLRTCTANGIDARNSPCGLPPV